MAEARRTLATDRKKRPQEVLRDFRYWQEAQKKYRSWHTCWSRLASRGRDGTFTSQITENFYADYQYGSERSGGCSFFGIGWNTEEMPATHG